MTAPNDYIWFEHDDVGSSNDCEVVSILWIFLIIELTAVIDIKLFFHSSSWSSLFFLLMYICEALSKLTSWNNNTFVQGFNAKCISSRNECVRRMNKLINRFQECLSNTYLGVSEIDEEL